MIEAGSFRLGGRGRLGLARRLALASTGLLAACGSGEAEQPPAAVSADEARAVGEAATMLSEQRHADRSPESTASPSPTSAP